MNISLSGITVHFTLKKVLTDLNVTFQEKELHAILGENGAGKSTLAKVMSGELRPGKGQIFLNGDEVHLPDAKTAIQKGICHVHQRPILAESISVKENLLLGVHNIDETQFIKLCAIWLKDIPLSKKLSDTSSDQRFFIALTGALLKNPQILILDEPSALLDSEQRKYLFFNLKKLAADGMNIIIITHDLKEALTFCNTITVLKDGEVQKEFLKNQTSEQELSELIFGPSTSKDTLSAGISKQHDFLSNSYKTSEIQNSKKFTLEFLNITAKPLNKPSLFDLSFTAESGQITLIQGLPESGLFTLEQIITGTDTSRTTGTVLLKDSDSSKDLFSCTLKHGKFNTRTLRTKMGIKTGIIPTDRTFTGSNPILSIEEMLTTTNSTSEPPQKNKDFSANNSLRKEDNTQNRTQSLIAKAGINITPKEKAANLSGGMLQKLIFARETDSNPELLILCEPLQGLDNYSCKTLIQRIKDFAQKNMMIIVLSSTPFPHQICQRIYNLDSGYFIENTNRELIKEAQ